MMLKEKVLWERLLIPETKKNIYKQKRCDAKDPNEIFSN